jgi:ribosome-binding protein aMBF1 (putative translation factor)
MPQGKEDSMANDEEPRKPRTISVTEDVYAIITREAKERGISRSALVREFAILISDRKAKKEIR